MNTTRTVFLFWLISLVLIAFILTSCMEDKFELERLDSEMKVKQEWSAPLIRGELTIDDLLQSFDSTNVINEDSQGLLYLVYEDSVFSQTAEDEFNIPIQLLDFSYNVPPVPSFNDTIETEIDTMYQINFENEASLDSVIMDQFTMEQSISNETQHELEIIITCKSIVKNGKPYKDTITVSPNDSYQATRQYQNYTLHAFEPDTSNYKYLDSIQYKVTIYGNGNPLNEGEEISVENQIESINIQAAYGYMGQKTLLSENREIPINLFDMETFGTTKFKNPQFRAYISNSYGIPLEISLENVLAHYPDNTTQQLEFENNSHTDTINHPSFPSQVGESVKDTFEISNENCNLSEILLNQPERISFEATGRSNPEGDVEPNYNFITDQSKFSVKSEVLLPLWLKTNGISLQDTFDLDLGSTLSDNSNFNKLITTFLVKNGLPVDIDLQVYFCDQNYRIIDTVFNQDDRPVIVGAQVNDNGEVIPEKIQETTTESMFNEKEFGKLNDVKNAIFQATLTTSAFDQDQMVKFYSDYSIQFRMSAELGTKFNINQ